MPKKKIAILGSTGSIGKSLVDIIKSNKKNFKVVLLTANNNDKLLLKQAKELNVKNIIITNKEKFQNINKKKYKINIYNDFSKLQKIFNTKVDYIMSSITGIDGLEPTYLSIKHTKTIAIANKESIICAWNILKRELNKNKTIFIPVDSEHFSIWSSINRETQKNIDKIYITASGGPFYNLPLKKFKKITIKDAVKHPNWKMGKKISVDSATMMNKVFELIEAKNIFSLPLKNLKILIHRESYLHAIVKFKSGITKMIIHDTDMKIPIFGTLNFNKNYYRKLSDINIKKINNLNLQLPNLKKFPLIKILNKLPTKFSLFETLIVSTNDILVDLFLNKKIDFTEISKIFFLVINDKDFNKYKYILPKKISDITKVKKFVQMKIKSRYI
tara:strand:+ start:216 stop:1376 length:1161 start_codon:yes stop_codon:yes gene_type:complete